MNDDDESKTELDHFLRLRLRFVPLFPHTNKVARFNRSTIFCFFLEMKFVQFLQWPIKVTGAVSLARFKSFVHFLFFPIMVDNLNAAAALGGRHATPARRERGRARARACACAGGRVRGHMRAAACYLCVLLPAACCSFLHSII